MLNTNHQFSIENHSFSDHTPKQPLEQLQHRAELTVTQAPGYITVVVTRVLCRSDQHSYRWVRTLLCSSPERG